MNDPLLTFEMTRDADAIEIHTDQKGLDSLINILQTLREQRGHVHLMTAGWGGGELSEDRQAEENTLVNHVKVILWETESKKIERGSE